MIKILNVTCLILYCSLIFWLSSKESLHTPMLFPHQDKIHHMGAYFIMGIFAWRCFNDYLHTKTRIIISSVLFCSLYGLSDEYHQSFVIGRTADVLDWLADSVGAIIAMIFIQFLQKYRQAKK